jgi:DNA-binding MarR family transcriptional regulator
MEAGARTISQGLVRLMLAVEDAYTDASREVGLTAQQAQLLCLARRSAPIGELAVALRCDRSNVSRMVDRASGRGLVARRPSADDGRVVVVGLTAEGERTMRRFVETLDARISALVSGWPRKRRAAALAVLNELAAALEAGAAPERRAAPPHAEPALRGL